MFEPAFHIEFYVLCAVLGWLALRGLVSRRRVFEFPTVAALLSIAWVVPQGIDLERSPSNPYSSGAFWLYVTACFLFVAWGFRVGLRKHLKRLRRSSTVASVDVESRRLLYGAIVLTVIGQFGHFMISGTDTSGMRGGWTGIVTMYYLIATTSTMGLCLAMLIFARTRSLTALMVAVIAVTPLAMSVLAGARREQLFDIVILTAGSWYLSRRRFPSRLAVVTCFLVGAVFLNKAGEFRDVKSATGESLAHVILSGEVFQNPDGPSDSLLGPDLEMTQAQYDFWYVGHTGRWEYGADYWNHLVHQYVPAFVFGREFKDSLKVETLKRRLLLGAESGEFYYGATRTGFSDSYTNFGVFGVLVFWFIGYIFGYLYARSRMGGIAGQYFYLVLLAEGLKAITHSTSAFFVALPYVVVVSLVVFRSADKGLVTAGARRRWKTLVGTRSRTGSR